MAATVVVSSRIDGQTAARAAARIKAGGLTVGEVIRRVWEQIARTGELPQQAARDEAGDALERLRCLQARFSDMPASFNTMSEGQMRDILGDRDA